MNRMTKTLLSVGAILFGVTCLAGFSTTAQATTISPPPTTLAQPQALADENGGQIGDVTWKIEGDTLTLSGGTLPNSGNTEYDYPWSNSGTPSSVTKVVIEGGLTLEGDSGQGLFKDLTHVTSIEGLDKLVTTNTTSMQNMFLRDYALTSIDLSAFHTENVTNMSDMFGEDHALTSLDVSQFETGKVESMDGMFDGDNNLTSLDVSNFDTSQVRDMGYMFDEDYELTTLDLSNFDTRKVDQMDFMFAQDHKLTSICFGKLFDTANVVGMTSMFEEDRALKAVDVSHFDTAKVENMDSMFLDDASLSSLDLSSFDTDQVEEYGLDDMLTGATNLTRLVLGPQVELREGVGLEAAKDDNDWQAVAKGTIEQPAGQNFDPDNLVEKYAAAGVPKELYVPEDGFKDQSKVTVTQSITLALGDKFDATEHFISAITPEGRSVTKYCDAAAEGLVIDGGNIDTSKPGTYTVTYHFYGSDQKATMTVTIPAAGGGGGGSVTPPAPITPAPQPTPTPSSAPAPTEPTKPTTPNIPNYAATKKAAVYALKTIYLYQNPTFKKSQRMARYKVRDVNHHSKTDGKIGYITAKWSHVRPVYYRSMPKGNVITVLSKKGVHAYKNKNLTGRVKSYKLGTHLKVKSLVKHNLTTRYVLSNGYHVTANKKLVIQGKY